MNIKYLIIIALITVVFLVQCKSKEAAQAANSHERIIKFGSGGGFSGQVKTYNLSSGGVLWQDNSPLKPLKVDAQRCDQLFKNYENLGFETLKLNEPGNLYYFISMMEEGKAANKLTWGSHNGTAPQSLDIYYNNLKDLATQFNAQSK